MIEKILPTGVENVKGVENVQVAAPKKVENNQGTAKTENSDKNYKKELADMAEAIKEAKKYDKENGDNLYETLFVFLKYSIIHSTSWHSYQPKDI